MSSSGEQLNRFDSHQGLIPSLTSYSSSGPGFVSKQIPRSNSIQNRTSRSSVLLLFPTHSEHSVVLRWKNRISSLWVPQQFATRWLFLRGISGLLSRGWGELRITYPWTDYVQFGVQHTTIIIDLGHCVALLLLMLVVDKVHTTRDTQIPGLNGIPCYFRIAVCCYADWIVGDQGGKWFSCARVLFTFRCKKYREFL